MHWNARHFLIAGLEQPVKTSDLSHHISGIFKQHLSFRMPLSDLRQLFSFFLSCNERLFVNAQIMTSASDVQFGHSGQMASGHYNGDERLPDSLDRGIFKATVRSSATWQMFMGHPPDLMQAISFGEDNQNAILGVIKAIREGRYTSPSQQVFQGTAGIIPEPGLAITTNSLVDALRRDLMPELTSNFNRTLARAHASVVDLFKPKQAFPSSNALPAPLACETHPFLLQKAREFMGDTTGLLGFTCVSQAEVTQLMYDRQRNISYCTATGMWFLPSFFFFILSTRA
jgi:hypothetical protein